ncbi:multidrug ABC transporter permease [Paenibacillus swuensis]|uniref:Multidrug ABC transporter permease n=1 Tax=Paenibacillus swuensis TaxID=1178515 RepID=A0A172THY6_9BACL|nr:ABC transporter ATP-binding protein [Paenibacillus swuensis]ANE46576.1 multidrug ABC transporter permease [Paenibacillus swuensis]
MQDDNQQLEQMPKGATGRFIRLVRQAKPSGWLIAAAATLSLAGTVASLFVPMFTKDLIDGFSMDSINRTQVIILVSAALAQALAAGFSIYLLNRLGQHVVANIRDRLWKKLLVLPIPYYDNHQTGDTISRMTNDTAVVKGLVSDHTASFLTGIISILGSVTILLFLDWRMTLVLLAAVPLTIGIMVPLGRRMVKIARSTQHETASFTAVLSQVLSEIRLVKSSGAEDIEYRRGHEGISKLFGYGVREGRVQAMVAPLMSFVIMMLLVVIIGYGGVRVASGALTAGELVAFLLYLFQIIFPISQVSTFFTQLQKTVGATERIIATLEVPEEDPHAGKEVLDASQPIRVEGLSFRYAEEGEPIVSDLTFTIPTGKVTAIVGPSGGGKTTLFSLLERYYTPTQGVIRLGADAIDTFSLKSWRSQIGYVSQESPILAGTIRYNIAYGLEREVSEEELRRAAEMAYADLFIRELPEGYETEVGERGIKLSGGQRQRIGIARALLRNPNILMLDEATSALDSQSEGVVQQALSNLMAGRTTLVIAHRLSTVVDADQIIFIEKGRITGSGTHEQLLESHDLYREFATQQLRLNEIGNEADSQ